MFFLDPTRGIESKGVTASVSVVNYAFDPFHEVPVKGFLLVDLQQPIPAGTAVTLPVTFGGVQLLTSTGANATVADLGGAGATSLIQVYFNSATKRLQLVGTYEALQQHQQLNN